jgi:serine phosphatase RsbU (regulator of sigma subunit)/ketosteroid isomerase-like protein
MPLYSDVIVACALVVVAVVAAISTAKVRQVNRRFRMFDAISGAADEGATLDETLEAIAEILIPGLGDLCAIDVIEGEGVRRVVVRAEGPQAAATESGLQARGPRMQEEIADAASRERQEPRLFKLARDEDLRVFASDEEDFEFLRSLGVRYTVAVELRARGRPTGMLTISVGPSGRRFRDSDVDFINILAGRIALNLDNAGLFSDLARSERERAEIAETLQRGLLPPPLPHIPGWSVAATYRPAGAENEIGGDFYDAFRIASGWMVVIGDVTGRGAHAAAVTAHARYTLRTAAALTGDPVVALRTLNRELLARSGTALCSVAAMAVSDDPRKPVQLALAGHLPPLLVDDDSVVEVSEPAPVLGAFAEDTWKIDAITVEPGQQLVFVTDGVTEAVGDDGRFGEERLRAELTTQVTSPARAAQRIEAALHEFTGGILDDDAAIVVIAPASADAEPAPEEEWELVERLYAAFNRRNIEEIVELCDEEMGFFPAGTAEQTGRSAPYVGPAGLQEYLSDVERVWDELLITPKVAERRAGSLLVRGRVYARSRALGIRDVPVAWVWDLHDGAFHRGEVFPDPEEAIQRLTAAG